MNHKQLIDYMLNNDLQVQIMNDDVEAIRDSLEQDGFTVSPPDIIEAIEDAKKDPYMQRLAGGRTAADTRPFNIKLTRREMELVLQCLSVAPPPFDQERLLQRKLQNELKVRDQVNKNMARR